jgi:signal transduction histidine kinase
VDHATILIVSDDPSFSSAVTARWQKERATPSFILMGGDLCHDLSSDTFDIAIVGAVNASVLAKVLRELETAANPTLLISETYNEGKILDPRPHKKLTVIRGNKANDAEDWLNGTLQLAGEMLSRRRAELLCQQLQHACVTLQRQADLGNYMIDVRHNLNNALTSVLGNSELLLLDCESMPQSAQSQLESVRNMALRMHEILQRFSSLEKELKVAEKEAERTVSSKARAVAAGTQ